MLGTFVVAPVVVEVVIDILLVLSCLIAIGFLLIYRATLKQILVKLADLFDAVKLPGFLGGGHIFGPISSFLRTTAEGIDRALAAVVGATQGGIVYIWQLLARQVIAAANFLASLAITLEHRLTRLVLGEIPRQLRDLEGRVGRTVRQARFVAAVAVAAAVARIDHALDGVHINLGGLRRDLGRAVGRVRGLERLIYPAAAAGLVATALARLGMSWLGCRNVRKIGRRACGLDPSLLDALIADSLLFFGTFSLVAFAEELQDVTGEVSGAIHALTRQA